MVWWLWSLIKLLLILKYNKMKLTIIFLFLTALSYGQLIINEVQSSNNTTLDANDGGNYDWIEIYNLTDDSLDLMNYFLSDKADNPTK